MCVAATPAAREQVRQRRGEALLRRSPQCRGSEADERHSEQACEVSSGFFHLYCELLPCSSVVCFSFRLVSSLVVSVCALELLVR